MTEPTTSDFAASTGFCPANGSAWGTSLGSSSCHAMASGGAAHFTAVTLTPRTGLPGETTAGPAIATPAAESALAPPPAVVGLVDGAGVVMVAGAGGP